MRPRLRVLLPLCCSLFIWLAPSVGRAEVIERVAAIVNDQAVLLSDLRRRAAPFLEQVLAGANSQAERMSRVKQLYKRLLQQLVDEELIEQAAKKMHVSVSVVALMFSIPPNMKLRTQVWEYFGYGYGRPV